MYDGYCNLCSRTVQWVIRNDRRKRFAFEPLQEADPAILPPGKTEERIVSGDTVVLFMNGRVYDRSTAVLKIVSRLRFPWPILAIFFVVPRVLRDAVYKMVARNRNRWFGRRSTCYLP